jgi:hypothetical protein
VQNRCRHVRLGEIGQAYLRFAVQNQQNFALMFGPMVRNADHAELAEAARCAFEVLQRTTGAGDSSSPEGRAVRLWAMVHGLAHLVVDEQLTLDQALAALAAAPGDGSSATPAPGPG